MSKNNAAACGRVWGSRGEQAGGGEAAFPARDRENLFLSIKEALDGHRIETGAERKAEVAAKHESRKIGEKSRAANAAQADSSQSERTSTGVDPAEAKSRQEGEGLGRAAGAEIAAESRAVDASEAESGALETPKDESRQVGPQEEAARVFNEGGQEALKAPRHEYSNIVVVEADGGQLEQVAEGEDTWMVKIYKEIERKSKEAEVDPALENGSRIFEMDPSDPYIQRLAAAVRQVRRCSPGLILFCVAIGAILGQLHQYQDNHSIDAHILLAT